MITRLRFAPSPTGHLHIGGARTALFNFLLARKTGGAFLLRIEDTDAQRSSQNMVQEILEGLDWLGLHHDEGPFYQSQRLDLYSKTCRQLLENRQAYRCFLSTQELEAEKAQAQQEGRNWLYPKQSREMDPAESDRRAQAGEAHVLRFKVEPGHPVRFKDTVFKSIQVERDSIEDFVILRSDGMPTYHLSVVADDNDMHITHVVRGVDHLINTAKHILLCLALGGRPPQYAHLPLILGEDRKRLSKRHGATSVTEYRKMGFLPGAVRNALALLGWSPKSNQEIYPGQSLIEEFDLRRVNKADAVFDIEKLLWINGKYISAAPAEDLEEGVRQAIQSANGDPSMAGTADGTRFRAAIDLLKARMRTFQDFADKGRAYFFDDFPYDPAAVEKFLRPEDVPSLITALVDLRNRYADCESFDQDGTERILRDVCETHGLKAGALIGALRTALTGQAVAPSVFEVVAFFGRDRVLKRLDRLVAFLK